MFTKLKLPTHPLGPAPSSASRITWVPACRLTPAFVTVVQDCHPPVSGTESGPLTSRPPNSTWKVPPFPEEATRTSRVKIPAAPTFTVYSSHSPGAPHPTLNAPSDEAWRSTPSPER